MLILLLVLLLFSNAVTLRRDKSILFSRIVIVGLLLTSFLAYTNFYVRPLEKDIGIYGGLFNVSAYDITNLFNNIYKYKIDDCFSGLFSEGHCIL